MYDKYMKLCVRPSFSLSVLLRESICLILLNRFRERDAYALLRGVSCASATASGTTSARGIQVFARLNE